MGSEVDIEFIAEIGLNHNGSRKTALRLIDEAVEAGATCVKFQAYQTAERVSLGHPLWTVLEDCKLSPDDLAHVRDHAENRGADFLCTAFGTESLSWLGGLGVDRVKIASFSIGNRELVLEAADQFELVISTGTSTLSEIQLVDRFVKEVSGQEVLFLHCMSAYPTAMEDANLVNIRALSALVGRDVGYSDHTLGSVAATVAVALGAVAIEKHFTADKRWEGPDHSMSADPQEFNDMVRRCRSAREALGKERGEEPFECEAAILPFRRSSEW